MDDTSHNTWATAALRNFLRLCFASAATTVEWDALTFAAELRKAAEVWR